MQDLGASSCTLAELHLVDFVFNTVGYAYALLELGSIFYMFCKLIYHMYAAKS